MQNIGGIANMTVLPKGGELDDVFACDTGPGNMLIDEAVRYITGGAEEFDRDGERAARGRVDRRLVQRWLAESYCHLPPPKSTGRELYGRERAREFFAQAEDQGVTGDDLVATITQLTIDSILLHYRRDVIPRFGLDEVIVGGGGCRNRTLMDGLSRGLGGVPVRTHEAYGIPSEAKEAIAFALLAYLTVMGRPGNLPNATRQADEARRLGRDHARIRPVAACASWARVSSTCDSHSHLSPPLAPSAFASSFGKGSAAA